MKVILLKDVKSQGKKGDVINVSDGYARNYLIRLGFAEEVNNSGLNEIAQKKAAEELRLEKEKKDAEELFNKINGVTVKVLVKCGEKGKIFGSVTAKEIAEQLEKQGISIDKRKIVLKEAIKQTGRSMIDIKVYNNMTARVNLVVDKEEI
jgi:large subunit ribosomal protein L9